MMAFFLCDSSALIYEFQRFFKISKSKFFFDFRIF